MSATAAEYDRLFVEECLRAYPAIDEFEARAVHKMDRVWLEVMARVLACPAKKNPPNWQHGRVLYTIARFYYDYVGGGLQSWVDIGTAKGFSACVLAWALVDAGAKGSVYSYDVVDPDARVERNSVLEASGLTFTVAEFVEPFRPPAADIHFLTRDAPLPARVNLAFVDGKHNEVAVRNDIAMLTPRQRSGDVIVFDDIQIHGIKLALTRLGDQYEIKLLWAKPDRGYAIARRLP